MSTKHSITITDFCVYHNVEHDFITSLDDAGLIKTTRVDQTVLIPETELQKLERMIRLHHDLEINLAGIEAITHLLQRVEVLTNDMQKMRNKLLFYEGDDQ